MKVTVTNVPCIIYLSAEVEIPDEEGEDDVIQNAIHDAFQMGWIPSTKPLKPTYRLLTKGLLADGVGVEPEIGDGWLFDIEGRSA